MAKRYSNLYLKTSGMPMYTKIKEGYEDVGHDRVMSGSCSEQMPPFITLL